MKYEINENGICMVFDTDEQQRLRLLYLGRDENVSYCDNKYSMPFELGLEAGYGYWKKKIFTDSQQFKFTEYKDYRNENGRCVEFIVTDDELEITLCYQFLDGVSAIRTFSKVKNIGKKSKKLFYISSFNYCGIDYESDIMLIHNGWCTEMWPQIVKPYQVGLGRFREFSSKRLFVSNTGSNSTKEYLPMGYFGGLMWQIENNGSWQWEISDVDDRYYISLSGPSDETGWQKILKPNECFNSVKTCITVGKDFESALGELTKYRRLIKATNEEFLKQPVIYNDYMNGLFGKPTTEKELSLIDAAKEVGAEYYCIDCGWYADGDWWDSVGEWKPSSKRFPNGIEEVFEYIKDKGMVPGVWLEPEVMGVNCPVAKVLPDECFFMRDGKRIVNRQRFQLDYRSEKVIEYMTSVFKRMIEDYGIGFFKLDYNIEIGEGTEVCSDSLGDGLLESDRAYIEWLKNIKKQYPNVIFENCGSGGMRMDYALLSTYHLQSTSDQESFVHTSVIAANSAIGVLPEQAGIWSYPPENATEKEVIFNMVNSMAGCLYLSGKLDMQNAQGMKLIKEAIEVYKVIRTDIKSFMPIYPIGLNSFEDGKRCVCYKVGEKVYAYIWSVDENACFSIPAGNKKVRCLYPRSNDFEIIYNGNDSVIKTQSALSAGVFLVE